MLSLVMSQMAQEITYAEAGADPKWIEALLEGSEALQSNHTWDIMSLPTGNIRVGCN